MRALRVVAADVVALGLGQRPAIRALRERRQRVQVLRLGLAPQALDHPQPIVDEAEVQPDGLDGARLAAFGRGQKGRFDRLDARLRRD